METTKTDLHQRLTLPRELLDVLKWHVDEVILPRKMRESELLFPSVTGWLPRGSCLDKRLPQSAKRSIYRIGHAARHAPHYQDCSPGPVFTTQSRAPSPVTPRQPCSSTYSSRAAAAK